MPSTPYAKLLVALNAGPTQSGGITAANGDTVQFSAESTAEWDVTVPPRWEIYAYPPGWTGPGVPGWTTESVPQAGGGTADVYVFLGLGPPPSFTLPALPMWGKFLCKLTVSGGLLNGNVAPQLIDDLTALQIVGPNGLYDIAVGEQGQFDQARAWVGSWQDDLRILDAALVGAATAYVALPEPVEIGAGGAGGINEYSRGDHSHPVTVGAATTIAIGDAAAAGGGTALAGAAHVHALPAPTVVGNVDAGAGALGVSTAVAREDHAHQVVTGTPVDVGTANDAGVLNALARADHVHALTFATLNGILATANAPITVNGQTLTSGGFIGPYFASNAAITAQTGLFRATYNTTALAIRRSDDLADLPVIVGGGADDLFLGDTGWQNVTITTAANTFVFLKAGAVALATAFPTVFAFFTGSPDNAGGNGVIQIPDATTEPTGGSSGSAFLWAFGGAARSMSQDFVKNTIVAALENVVNANEDLRAKDRKKTRVQTLDASPSPAITYALPESCTVDFVCTVVAYSVDGPLRSRWRIEGGAGRLAAAGATIMGTNDSSQKNDAGAAGWTAVVDTNANDLRVVLTGAAITINWFVMLEVMLMDPM